MKNVLKTAVALAATFLFAHTFLLACAGSNCDPESEADCVCKDDSGAVCALGDDGCECRIDEEPENNPNGDPNNKPTPPYKYVLVEDLATDPDEGAAIDAIVVTKAGDEFYALGVGAVQQGAAGTGDVDATSCNGPPDVYDGYPDTTTCTGEGYFSLGGEGGYVVMLMAADIEVGDTVTVVEVNNCLSTGAPQIRVSVGNDRNLEDPWVEIATDAGPTVSAKVGQ